MTTNSPNQPNHAPRQNGYNPVTLNDVARPPQWPWQAPWQDYFGELRDPIARCVAAPLLFFIFVFSGRDALLAPLTLLVLLGCLLIRLENHPRQIAAVPLTLAAIKLAFEMASLLNSPARNALSLRSFPTDPGFIWLPMFFSACLVFIPRRESATFKIILAGSIVLLASGLLPGQGFVAIFYLLDYTLFIAMIVGIFVDLKAYSPAQVQNNLRPAQQAAGISQ
jgi:hypothetical protein